MLSIRTWSETIQEQYQIGEPFERFQSTNIAKPFVVVNRRVYVRRQQSSTLPRATDHSLSLLLKAICKAIAPEKARGAARVERFEVEIAVNWQRGQRTSCKSSHFDAIAAIQFESTREIESHGCKGRHKAGNTHQHQYIVERWCRWCYEISGNACLSKCFRSDDQLSRQWWACWAAHGQLSE